MKSISIVGEQRGDRFHVILSSDDGRRDEEEFDTEEEAHAAIRRMWAAAQAYAQSGVVKITVDQDDEGITREGKQ